MLFSLLLPLIGIISTTQAQYTRTRKNASEIITFDDTCSDVQQGVVLQALGDAFSMTDLVRSLPGGGVDDGPAYMDLFGVTNTAISSQVQVDFDRFVHGSWNISAAYDTTNSVKLCADRGRIGEIGGKYDQVPFRAQVVFCKEFWELSLLDIQVRKAIGHPSFRDARYDLGYYSDNHATSVLQRLFQHIGASNGYAITALWPLLPFQGGAKKYAACHGVHCARLLARVNPIPPANVSSWTTLSWTENWALYALAKYVQTLLEPGIYPTYPFLPLLERRPSADQAAMETAVNLSGVYVTSHFSAQGSPSQLHYNVTRYEYLPVPNDTFVYNANYFNNLNIVSRPDIRNWTVSPMSAKYNTSLNEFITGWQKQADWDHWNFNLNMKHSCFAKENNTVLQSYDIKEAQDLAREYCNKTILPLMTPSNGTYADNHLVPLVSGGIGRRKSFMLTSLPRPRAISTTQLTFAIGASINATMDRLIPEYFVGVTPEKKVENCMHRFEEMINNCNGEPNGWKFGAMTEIADRLYAVWSTPKTHNATIANVQRIPPMKCNNLDVTGYWRITDAFMNVGDLDTNRLRNCWIPTEGASPIPDLFCKPKGGCADVESGKERVYAQTSPSGYKYS